MGNSVLPGPVCKALRAIGAIDAGTLCRNETFPPGVCGFSIEDKACSPGGRTTPGQAARLLWETVEGPTASKDHVGFKWMIFWKLDRPSEKGGCIVQRVERKADVRKWDGAKSTKIYYDGTKKLNHKPYWEAWVVKNPNSGRHEADRKDSLRKHMTKVAVDNFDFQISEYKKEGLEGTIEQLGIAEFFEGQAVPLSMIVGVGGMALGMRSSYSDPGLVGGSGPICHSIKMKFDYREGKEEVSFEMSGGTLEP